VFGFRVEYVYTALVCHGYWNHFEQHLLWFVLLEENLLLQSPLDIIRTCHLSAFKHGSEYRNFPQIVLFLPSNLFQTDSVAWAEIFAEHLIPLIFDSSCELIGMVRVNFPSLLEVILYEAVFIAGSKSSQACKRIRINVLLAVCGVKRDNRSIKRVQHRLVDDRSRQVWQTESLKDLSHVFSYFDSIMPDTSIGRFARLLRFCRCWFNCGLSCWVFRAVDWWVRSLLKTHFFLLQNAFSFWCGLRSLACIFLSTASVQMVSLSLRSLRSLTSFHFVLVITGCWAGGWAERLMQVKATGPNRRWTR